MVERTPLYEWHRTAGARVVEFGGWEMPLQYTGIVDEHLVVRRAVGLFDVSHMGKILVEGARAHESLDRLSANEISRVPGHAAYTHLLRSDGTVLDDVIVTCLAATRFLVVCNAAPRNRVVTWLQDRADLGVEIRDLTAQIGCVAVQGPRAPDLLLRSGSVDIRSLKHFSAITTRLFDDAGAAPQNRGPEETVGWGSLEWRQRHIAPGGTSGATISRGRADVLVTLTGYTGEPGFELFLPAHETRRVWEAMISIGADLEVQPIGLGARDTLRLEKGYLLSGQDFDGSQTPLEAGCGWVVKWGREFLGKEGLAAQRVRDDYRRLVGIRMEDRAIPRNGQDVRTSSRSIGIVTSGTFSPSLRVGIALAYVDRDHAVPGSAVQVSVRGVDHPARVVRTPFR